MGRVLERSSDANKVGKDSGVVNSVSRAKVALLLLLISTAVVAPFISVGYSLGDDVAFHLGTWFEMGRQWREGIAYARWAGQELYGYGNPVLIFYPPLCRILGGALVVCLPSRMALGAYAWIVLLLGGFSFFYLCRTFFDDRSSLVAAFAYVINPYNLVVLYIRCALPEFLGAALFPLLILAVLHLGEKGKRGVAVLTLFIALLWLTNVPAGVIANYTTAIIVVVLALVRRSKSLLGPFMLAEILGAGLAAFYLLPAWRQQPWINLVDLSPANPADACLLSGQWYEHSIHSLDVVLTAGFLWQVTVGAFAWFQARRFLAQERDIFVALIIVLAVSTFMCVPVSFLVWKYAPFLHYVQFPWRWLFPLNLSVTFFIAAALSHTERHSWLAVAACGCSFLIILSCFTVRKRVVDWKEFAVFTQSGGKVLGAWTYAPRAVGELPEDRPPAWLPSPRFAVLDGSGPDRPSLPIEATPGVSANQTTFAVQSWQTESRVFTVDSPQPARVRVRLFYYPGWHVSVNGNEVKDVERDAHDAIVLRVPSGHSRVQLEFKRTPDETWGIIISCLVAILAVTLSLPQVNRQRRFSAVE